MTRIWKCTAPDPGKKPLPPGHRNRGVCAHVEQTGHEGLQAPCPRCGGRGFRRLILDTEPGTSGIEPWSPSKWEGAT